MGASFWVDSALTEHDPALRAWPVGSAEEADLTAVLPFCRGAVGSGGEH